MVPFDDTLVISALVLSSIVFTLFLSISLSFPLSVIVMFPSGVKDILFGSDIIAFFRAPSVISPFISV
jgi:hypothetical protein